MKEKMCPIMSKAVVIEGKPDLIEVECYKEKCMSWVPSSHHIEGGIRCEDGLYCRLMQNYIG